MKNFILATFLLIGTIYSQQDNLEDFENSSYVSLSGGILVGDSRFYPTLNTAFSVGYYLTNNACFSLNYSPINIVSNNNHDPLFYIDGKPLLKDDSDIIHQLHFVYSNRIIKNIWLSFGFVPFGKSSYLLGIDYKTTIHPNVDILLKNHFITIGRYFFDDLHNSFATHRFSLGIEYRP